METLLSFGLIALVAVGIVAFLVSAWRRSEREHERWQSRRGEDEHREGDGAYRSHWGGMGRPGSGL